MLQFCYHFDTYKYKLENKDSDNNAFLYTVLFIVVVIILAALLNQNKMKEQTSKQEDKVKDFLDKL